MKIRINIFIYFLEAWFVSVLSIIIYNYAYNVSSSHLPVAILNSFFSSFTLVFIIDAVFNGASRHGFNGASFLLLSAAFYNQNSIFKFSVDTLFAGFIDNPYTRLLGSIYVDLILIVTTVLVIKTKNKYSNKTFILDSLYIPQAVVLILAILYLMLNLVMYVKTGETFATAVSRFMQTIDNLFKSILYVLLGVSLSKTEGKRSKYLGTYLSAIIVIFTALILSALSGKKSALILPIYSIMFILVYFGKLKKKHIFILAIFLPAVFQLLTYFTLAISGRAAIMHYSLLFQLQYNGFRFDLSDFAITVASRFSQYKHPIRILIEALEISVPKVFLPNKIEEVMYYNDQLNAMNIAEAYTQDFNDTLLSMGAQVGGFIGMALVVFLIAVTFKYFSYKLKSINYIGELLFLLSIQYYSTVESDWAMFIWNTRDILISIFLGAIIFRIIVRYKKNKHKIFTA